VKLAAAVTATLLVQRLLGAPGIPPWLSLALLPMVWLVAPPMLHRRDNPLVLGLLTGLGWDLLLEPVIGPGGIAWSGTALVVVWVAGRIADRSPKAWGAIGTLGALVVTGLDHLAALPLGGAALPSPVTVALQALATGLWCSLAGWLVTADLPVRWRRFRTRRLH